MTKHLARIISDCGTASYPFSYWRRLRPADWTELMEAAEAGPKVPTSSGEGGEAALVTAATGFAAILSHFQRAGSNVRQFRLYRKIARGRYIAIHNWFHEPHPDDYLGVIPRDILGIVEFYLRARVEVPDFNCFRTSILGIPQSFDGAPSEVREAATDRGYRWTQNGVLHRDGEPARITIDVHSELLECSWYRHGVPRPIYGDICAMIIGENYAQVRSATNAWSHPIDAGDTGALELWARLWEKYRFYRA